MKKLMVIVNTENQVHPTIDLALELLSADGGTIDIVTTMPRVPPLLLALWSGQDKAFDRELMAEKQTRLDEIASNIGIGKVTVSTGVLQGKPHTEIIKRAVDTGVDIVLSDDLIDSDRSGESAQGNTNFQLFRRCPQPVWLVNSLRPTIPAKIVAAVDVEDTHVDNTQLNAKILSTALELSDRSGVPLEIVHAWELYGESVIIRKYGLDAADRERYAYTKKIQAAADILLRPLREKSAPFRFHLLNGTPEVAIPAFLNANDVDLIVMGTVGRSGIPGVVLGNTAEKMMRTVTSSILALKPDGFQS